MMSMADSWPGLSEVASCEQKSPPTWLISAGYSAWHFFLKNIPGLATYFDDSAVYFKPFCQPWLLEGGLKGQN